MNSSTSSSGLTWNGAMVRFAASLCSKPLPPWTISKPRLKKLSAVTELYTLMPFRFSPAPDNRMLVVNEVGEFFFLGRETFEKLVSFNLDPASGIFLDLKGKHFLTDTAVTPAVDMLATKYRTKREFLKSFTGLHMVVITLRCNQRCHYCHASSQPTDQQRWDMTPETAINVVHKIMESPSEVIKIEFQGGEPLLNFEVD